LQTGCALAKYVFILTLLLPLPQGRWWMIRNLDRPWITIQYLKPASGWAALSLAPA
jgi:hypothetical protein